MKIYPALDVHSTDTDLIYAAVDDFAPTAIEDCESSVRVFFASADARDNALAALSPTFAVAAIEVPDDDWATRSQQNLPPITVGRFVIRNSELRIRNSEFNSEFLIPNSQFLVLTIPASRGFGTGHHATTRMCLAALQAIDLTGMSVLDVGTGSGILAFAADRLGAARALGIDFDPDAIESAIDNLALNPEARRTTFELADLDAVPLPEADVVTANLTGALLTRAAPLLLAATKPGGTLVLSGLMRDERDAVCRAFDTAVVIWEQAEDEWVGLAVKKR